MTGLAMEALVLILAPRWPPRQTMRFALPITSALGGLPFWVIPEVDHVPWLVPPCCLIECWRR